MFLISVRIFPRPGERQKIEGFLWGIVGPTRVQPGCIGCTLATETESEALLYMERWETKRDLLWRLASVDFSKVLQTMELSVTKPEVCIHEIVRTQGIELIEEIRTPSHPRPGVIP